MTAKEHVLQIYPDACIEQLGFNGWCIVSKHNNIDYEFVGSYTINPNRAWQKAWKDIQRTMLETLEK